MATGRCPRRYEFHGTLRFGGSCRPNPGHGSIGFLIYNDHDGTVLEKYSTYVNDCFRLTNNAAHYKALIAGLQHALWRGITHITALGHCQLVCQQVKIPILSLPLELIYLHCI